MTDASISKKRVIGLLSGNGSGKTTLAECFLYNTKVTNRLGSVESKNTVSDYSSLEHKKGFSISSSILNYRWKDFEVNLIDTPGYLDFIGQIYSTLKVVDSVVLPIDVKSGLQAATERVLQLIKDKSKPSFIIINKMDQENVDFFKLVDEIKDHFEVSLVPITVPGGIGEDFKGVIDILKNKAFDYKDDSGKGQPSDIDEKRKAEIEDPHNELIESIVETDDGLLNKYLEGEKIDDSSINKVFKNAVMSGKVIPVFAASTSKNIGIDLIMDYINELLPSPLEVPPVKAKEIAADKEMEVKPDPDGPVLAYVFKTMADPYIGKLSIFRVFSGTVNINNSYYVSSAESSYKFTNLFKLQGKDQQEIQKATCGDIIAVSKIMDISNDDTISSTDKPLGMEKIIYPEPVLPKTIIPAGKGDEEKISTGLSKLIEEDPTLKQELDTEVKQSIVWGMGDLSLSIVKENLKEKFDIDVDLLTPDIAYKETIKKEAKAEYKYKKQSGGRGQYGHVFIELKPLGKNEGFKFEDSIFGGAIPKGYIPGVEKGIREALQSGILAGYPVVDVYVNLYDGSFHSVDSSEMAFKIAASMAFKKGMSEANPVILEPVMELEVEVPEKYMGDIIGDINSKRGKILSMNPSDNKTQIIKLQLPQAESFNYSVDLKSITQGRGAFNQKFSHYEELPPNLAQEVIEERKKQDE